MKKTIEKISSVFRWIFGYGIVACLFLGGLTFFGYLAALCIGGESATAICTFIYKTFFPIIIKTSTILVMLGLVVMYLNGEVSLTISTKKNKK